MICQCLDFSTGRCFADDTNLTFSAINLPELQDEMNNDLGKVFAWLCSNKLSLNILKTEFMVIGSRQRIASLEGDISLSINRVPLRRVETTKCLGLNIDQFLTWNRLIQSIRHKVTCNVQVIRRVKPFLSLGNLVTLYRSKVEPYFSYYCIVWDGIGDTLSLNLQKLQNRAAQVLCTKNSLLKLVVSLVGYCSLR